jgi:cytochrome P450
LLRDDPSLARATFDEATRFDSGSHSLFRTTLRETELAGTVIGKHEKVLVSIAAAGRDPLQWEDPDRFDIRRKTSGHLGYGTGIHACVAQMMARLEAEVFFSVLAQRIGRIESNGPAVLRTLPGLRGWARLPLRVWPT